MEDSSEKLPRTSITEVKSETVFDRFDGIVTNRLEGPLWLQGRNGRISAATDEGIGYKPHNEDVVVINTAANALAVIDGLGGKEQGQLAAKILAQELQKGFQQGTKIEDIQKQAHLRMKHEVGSGGACFLTAEIGDRNLRISQAGDVKLVVLDKKGQVRFETKDEDLASRGQSHVVTNSVTGVRSGKTTRSEAVLNDGDRMIVASDGLWDNFTPQEVGKMIAGKPVGEASLLLARSVKEKMQSGRGKPDNVSVVIYDFEGITQGMRIFEGKKEEGGKTVTNAQSFGELYDALDAVGRLEGTQKVYTATELKSLIEKVRAGQLKPDRITRTGGLRSKVEELLTPRH